MMKSIKATTILITLMLMAGILLITVAAMGFSVTPLLPDNQRPNGSSFFDLIVTPGMQQDLTIRVSNTGDEEITVLVELITASTSRNGQINYTSRGLMDVTLKYSFEDMVSIPETHYTIPARGELEIPVSLTVPNDTFEGAILGSIRVLREATDQEREEAGAIVNQYAHVTAVRLVMSDDAEEIIEPDFALGSITTELVNYRASIIAHIRNIEPLLIKGASATAQIYPLGSDQPIFEHTMDSLDFAPNSVFPFSFVDRGGYGIAPGNYTAKITLQHGSRIWEFNENFVITPDEAEEVNEGAVNQNLPTPEVENDDSIPFWVYPALGIGGALLIAVIVLIIVVVKKGSRKGLPKV